MSQKSLASLTSPQFTYAL